MRSENEVRLHKIKKISNLLRVICKVLMALITLAFLAGFIALLINKGGTITYSNEGFAIGELTLRGRLILLALSALTFGIMFKCFFHLYRLLGNYSRGNIFTTESSGQIRQMGVACVLWGGLNVLWVFLPLAISSHRPKSFEGNLDFVVIGLIIIAISWFMEMAAELKEENELTV
jgi:hypothetical protein